MRVDLTSDGLDVHQVELLKPVLARGSGAAGCGPTPEAGSGRCSGP